MDPAKIRFIRKGFIKDRGVEVFRKVRPSPNLWLGSEYWINYRGTPEVSSKLGGVHIGARALHVLNLTWFGNISRLSQWVGRRGVISSFKWFLPAVPTCRGGGVGTLWSRAESYERKKAWASINRSILSGLSLLEANHSSFEGLQRGRGDCPGLYIFKYFVLSGLRLLEANHSSFEGLQRGRVDCPGLGTGRSWNPPGSWRLSPGLGSLQQTGRTCKKPIKLLLSVPSCRLWIHCKKRLAIFPSPSECH